MLLGRGTKGLIFTQATLVTPSDTLPNAFNALWNGGTAANITITTPHGDTVCFSNFAASTILPVACTLVKATGTAASPIIGLL